MFASVDTKAKGKSMSGLEQKKQLGHSQRSDLTSAVGPNYFFCFKGEYPGLLNVSGDQK